MKPHPQHGKVSANKTEEEKKKRKKERKQKMKKKTTKTNHTDVYVRICPERGTREVKAGKTRKTKSRLLSTY